MTREQRIEKRETEIRRKICTLNNVTENGKVLKAIVRNRHPDGRLMIFGVPLGRARKLLIIACLLSCIGCGSAMIEVTPSRITIKSGSFDGLLYRKSPDSTIINTRRNGEKGDLDGVE